MAKILIVPKADLNSLSFDIQFCEMKAVDGISTPGHLQHPYWQRQLSDSLQLSDILFTHGVS